MESTYILFWMIVFLIHHNKPIHSSGCQDLISQIGGNVTFEYKTSIRYRSYDLSFTHEGTDVIRYIEFLDGSKGFHSTTPEYRNRVSVYGYMDRPFNPPWNLSITLTNISLGDEGMYQLLSEPEPLDNASFCLFILDDPAILTPASMFGNIPNGTRFTVEGRDFILSGQPAGIFPSNSSFDVTMSWMFNGETIETGGFFIVHVDELVILSVPSSLHGSTVTYRASVDGTDVWTEIETRLVVVYMEVRLQPSQTLFAVNTGTYLPDIECGVTSGYETEVMWTRGDYGVITKGSILSLGQADVAMSGEYRCQAKLSITGQIKEKTVSVIVFVKTEPSEQPVAAIAILSTITGLTVTSVVVMAILLWRNGYWKRQEPTKNVSTSPATEMSSYTNLEFKSEDRQLYDIPGPSGVDVPMS